MQWKFVVVILLIVFLSCSLLISRNYLLENETLALFNTERIEIKNEQHNNTTSQSPIELKPVDPPPQIQQSSPNAQTNSSEASSSISSSSQILPSPISNPVSQPEIKQPETKPNPKNANCPIRIFPTPIYIANQSIQLILSCDSKNLSASPLCENDPAIRQFYQRIYPSFALKQPNFMQDEDRLWWEAKGYAVPGQTYTGDTKTQKFVYACPSSVDFCNKFPFDPKTGLPGEYIVMHSSMWTLGQIVVLDGQPNGDGCARWRPHLGYKTGIKTEGISAVKYTGPEQTIVHAISEEANSFQHFIDTLYPKLLHAWDIIDPVAHPDIKMWSQHTAQIPRNILNHIGFGSDKQVSRPGQAHPFVWLCHTPIRHPLLWRQMQTMLGVKPVPDEHKTNILFLRRPPERERKIVNEDEMMEAVTTYIESYNNKCGTKYKVLTFQEPEKTDIASLVSFFSKTKMVFGAHGGAMYNLLFCPPGTITVELFPKQRFGEHIFFASFWHISRFYDGEYYLLPRESLNHQHYMKADVDVLLNVFKKEFPMAV